METILIIPRELEFLEGLVKLTRRRKDVEGQRNQVVTIHSTLAIRKVSVNKTHCNKTLHLAIEINQVMIEGLVDTRASMSIMVANVVKELGIMHLVVSHETYETTSGIVPQTLRQIIELPVKVGRIMCQMIFLVVDIDNYDLLLGLDFLIKIRTVVTVEKGAIQVRNEPGMEVEVLPLNVINMLQVLEGCEEEKCNIQKELFNKMMGQLQIKDWANLFGALDFEDFNDEYSFKEEITKYEGKTEDGTQETILNSENEIEELKDYGLDLIIEEETLMQILNLTLQEQHKKIMEGMFSNDDDYANWIKCAVAKEDAQM